MQERQHVLSTACARCKRMKVRCVWNPGDTACTRCAKSRLDASCHPPPNPLISTSRDATSPNVGQSSVHKATGAAISLSTPTPTPSCSSTSGNGDLQSRVENMEDMLKQVLGELTRVKDEIGHQHQQQPPVDLTHPHAWQSANPLQALIDTGYMGRQQARHGYELFRQKLAHYCVFSFDKDLSMEQSAEKEPFKTLLMAVVGRASTSTSSSSSSSSSHDTEYYDHGAVETFCERVLYERVMLQSNFSLDAMRALALKTQFLPVEDERKLNMQVGMMAQMVMFFALGSKQDSRALVESGDHGAQVEAHGRMQVFLSLSLMVSAKAMHTSHHQFGQVMPSCTRAVRAMQASGLATPRDQAIICVIRMLQCAQEVYEKIAPLHGACELAPGEIRRLLQHVDGELAAQKRQLAVIEQRAEQTPSMRAMFLSLVSIDPWLKLVLHEAFVTQVVLRVGVDGGGGTTTIEPMVRQMVALCTELYESFTQVHQLNPHMPQFMYYRLLYALCGFLRARMIGWSLGLGVVVPVDDYFDRARVVWESMACHSRIAERIAGLCRKVDHWRQTLRPMSLEQAQKDEQGSTSSVVRMFWDLLRNAMMPDQSQHDGQGQDDGQGQGQGQGQARPAQTSESVYSSAYNNERLQPRYETTAGAADVAAHSVTPDMLLAAPQPSFGNGNSNWAGDVPVDIDAILRELFSQ